MGTFKVGNVDEGVYKETKTRTEDISIQHIRNMIKQREDKIVDLNGEITYFKDKETAIMALPNFKEPK